MIKNFAKRFLSAFLSVLLVASAAPKEVEAQQAAPTGYSGQGVPLTEEELQQLTGPIALYPDALVAQILGASTFPDQVANADAWLKQNTNLTGTNLMKAVDTQSWDPSVKALTQFPTVLDNMTKNLSWTSALGEAYHTQAADVMSAIQFLRAKAKAAGNLKSGSQITVVEQSPQTIVIQSANPQVVYVPTYNPAVVYGYPVVYPSYVYVAPPSSTAVLAFGVGIAVGAMMSSGCCGWGYSSWNCGWHSTTVVYHGGAYYGNAAWHGGYYGSGGVAHYGAGYNSQLGPMRVALRFQTDTALQAPVRRTTHPRGPMRVALQPRMHTAAQARPRRTTQGPGPLPPQCKAPTPTEAGEVPQLQRTAPQRTASIRRPRKELQDPCKHPTGPRRMAHRARMAIAPLWVRPQTVTSTRVRTATPTRTPGVVWTGIRTIPRSLVQVIPAKAHPRRVGVDRKRAVDHLPLAERVAEVGTPGRQVLAVGEVVAEVAAGADVAAGASADRVHVAAKKAMIDDSIFRQIVWENVMFRNTSRLAVTTQSLLFAVILSLAACNTSEQSATKVFASPEEAANTLLQAAKSRDQNALLAIFGPDSKPVISSGDAVRG